MKERGFAMDGVFSHPPLRLGAAENPVSRVAAPMTRAGRPAVAAATRLV